MTKKTIYLHIGMPKAGSTSIQDFIINNLSALNSKGIDYPLVKGNQNGEALFFAARQGNNEIISSIKQYIEASKTPNMIISYEGLHMHINEIIYALNTIEDTNFKVIFYMRRAIELTCSFWQQICKVHGCTKSLETHIKSEDITLWRIISNSTNNTLTTTIILLDRLKKQFVNGNLIADFCDFINIDYKELSNLKTLK